MTAYGVKAYTSTNILTTDPYKLILMLYEAALKHLFAARAAIRDGNMVAKGENISKAISIISELLNAVEGDEHNEAANFLRGLYAAILVELPKANLNNDEKIVELSIKYIAQLKNIWENYVMNAPRESGEPTTDNVAQQAMGAMAGDSETGNRHLSLRL